ncbi:MAG: radical SAM protein [Eubacteriales bacterium]|nr:radical SAM protein [Eubacteriales bacterium]
MPRTVTESLKMIGMRQVLSYVDRDFDRNAMKIADWLVKRDRKKRSVGSQAQKVKDALQNKEGNWHHLLTSIYSDIDDGVRRKLFRNFVVNASMIGSPRQRKKSLKHGCNIPWAILMDPTSACNLSCIGCWASEYGNRLSLEYDELDDIINQGKELGTYLYIYSGGEPLMRKEDIIRLCEKHSDCAFLAFTNGTLIDDAFADEMLRVKNFVPAISVEGFKETTDARRGAGTYDRVVKAMRLLSQKKLPYGISLCYTRQNVDAISSDEYIDHMISLGAKFAWFFTYMPVGRDAETDLMVTPAQREHMYRKVREWRETKPIFTLDFWNDGEYAGGCIAGGRSYLHINANGDIEPCAFIHYSDSNIKENTLLEAFRRPLFMQYYNSQPFNENLLRPCPLLDNPEWLAAMVDVSGAHSTEAADPEDVHALCAKCTDTAAQWAKTADRLWAEGPHTHKSPRGRVGLMREKAASGKAAAPRETAASR